MGVGMPENILECIERGVDMFDCVVPTRNARNGSVFSWQGKINIRNACYTNDFNRGLDETCTCYTCRHFTRGYLRHLIVAKEMLAATLLSVHNLHTLLQLARDMRQAILESRFDRFADDFLAARNDT